MGFAAKRLVAAAFLVLALAAPAWAQHRIVGKWLGQDSHDYCGEPTNAVKPNGVQDIHIALAGLPPQEIVFASITGHGADEWQFHGAQLSQYSAEILRKPRSPSADVFFEPNRVEKGREFCVKLTFADKSVVEVYLKGGHADPNLRMPDAAVAAKWGGQEKQDHAGAGPGVGPDGLVDARIVLTRLPAKDKVKSASIEDPAGGRWAFGVNPRGDKNAELIHPTAEPTQAALFFQPDRDLSGHKLKVTVVYESGKQDVATVAAGKTDPKLAMPKPSLPKMSHLKATARWLGQDGARAGSPGDVHVAVSGLSGVKGVAAAYLSDAIGRLWTYRAAGRDGIEVEAHSAPLAVERGNDRSTMHLFFAPVRDESTSVMTLRIVDTTGESHVATFSGGACDPDKSAPTPAGGEVVAKPGDDLNGLATRAGTLRLGRGEYVLNRPLILTKPIRIVGERESVLKFAQGAGEPPWTAAIKVHAGGTALQGFTVRFAGPVRWKHDVSWGPAVIGTTDNGDATGQGPKMKFEAVDLDLEGPPASKAGAWEEAPKLMRLVGVSHGSVKGCTLRGGVIECFEGPWTFEANEFRGTPAHEWTSAVFAVHDPHDVIVRNNRAKSPAGSGKTWRFLLFTTRGDADRVENNTIERIGPRDDDTIPSMNMPEIILTESYHIRFEGRPAAVSPDRTVVKVHALRGEAPRTGDVVSILAGPAAGQWRRVRQRIDATTYLLDEGLPKGTDVISIAPGFVNETFARNTIDARDGRAAAGFVLAGNHFGTKLTNNRIAGAGDAFQLTAYPSESPAIWGWTHAPYLGGVVENNVIEDSERGATIGVLHNEHTKLNKGRVYMSVNVKGNTVRWTDPFLSRLTATKERTRPTGLTLGFERSADSGEMVVVESDNRLEAAGRAPASSALRVHAAQLNGKSVSGKTLALPTGRAPASAGLNASQGSPRR